MESHAMFDSNRAAHCRGVAILMRRLAPALGLDANRMTFLGWIHDLGYLTGQADTHAPDLGHLLESESSGLLVSFDERVRDVADRR